MSARKLISMLSVAFFIVIAAILCFAFTANARNAIQPAKTSANVPAGPPAATIDLGSSNGVTVVKGEWRYSDTKIVEVDFTGPGADKQPTGAPVKTYDYTRSEERRVGKECRSRWS